MVRDEEQSIDPHAVTRAGTGGASGAARPKEEAPGGGELPAGTYLGKFRVIAPLGAGGMGVVYEAEDEVLDRRVAVKLMRPEVANSAGTERLLREARAAARLSHPNVVPVYEVGASPHGPFIAMERIDGPSLRAWIAEAPRSWRETLEAFCDAGRGLAAAHAAGLVHRDFKPDNAFIGSDGRVRVGDFGLVAAVGAAGAAGGGEPARTLEPDTLQRAGSASGTPLYMAPEQHRGESADARGDQFSFCLALYEALYGQHPFPVESVAELVAAYDQERAPARPPSSEVPSRVYELLARGLHVAPEQRFSSMSALLAELGRSLAPARGRRVAPYVVIAAAAGAAALIFSVREGRPVATPPVACDVEAAAAFGDAWGLQRRDALVAAFRASKHADAERNVAQIVAQLDRYGESWRKQHETACSAVGNQRTWPADLGHLASTCLGEARVRLISTVETLVQADTAVVQDGAALVTELPSPRACTDPEYLRYRAAVPRDPAKAAAIVAAEEGAAAISTAITLRRIDEAERLLAAALPAAEELDHGPLLASLTLSESYVLRERGDLPAAVAAAERAYLAARRSRAAEHAAQAAASLISLKGYYLQQFEEAERWADLGLAEIAEIPFSAAAVSVHMHTGVLAENRGQGERAVEHQRQAVEVALRLYGAESARYVLGLQALGGALEVAGRSREAMEVFREAMPLIAQVHGEHSPDYFHALSYLGIIEGNAGDRSAARRSSERALALGRTADAGGIDLATLLGNLGSVLGTVGEFEEAIDPLAEARRLYAEVGHPALAAQTQLNLGNARARVALERDDRALEALAMVDLAEAAAALEALWGPKHPDVGMAVSRQALVHVERRRCREALPLARRALDVYGGPDTDFSRAWEPQLTIARCQVAAGDFAAARRALEHAIRVIGAELDPLMTAELEGWLGVALIGAGDEEKGRAMLDRARAILAAATPPRTASNEAIDRALTELASRGTGR